VAGSSLEIIFATGRGLAHGSLACQEDIPAATTTTTAFMASAVAAVESAATVGPFAAESATKSPILCLGYCCCCR